jgi:hypothetical protein
VDKRGGQGLGCRRPVDCKYRARGRLKTKKQGSKPQDSEFRGRSGQAAACGHVALFDKGRALERCYQRHGAGSKGQGADGATAPRYLLSVIGRLKGFVSRGEHRRSRIEHEQEQPNVFNCASPTERQAGSACPTRGFQIVDPILLHAPCSVPLAPGPMLRHDQVMRRSSWSCCRWG